MSDFAVSGSSSDQASKETQTAVDTNSSKGIPAMEFIEDMDEYMKRSENEKGIELVLKRLEESHQKYKLVEASLVHRRARLKIKIPDLKQSLEILLALNQKKKNEEETMTRFMLSDQCYAVASVPPSSNVCLWLGANVMLEYSTEEAEELLVKNIAGAEKGIRDLTLQLGFIKDQLTTTEVNIARVYNWGVQQKQKDTAVDTA